MKLSVWIDGLLRDNKTGQVSTSRTAFFGAFLVAALGVHVLGDVAALAIIWESTGGLTLKPPPPAELGSLIVSALGAYAALLTLFLGAFVTASLGSKGVNAYAAVKGSGAKPEPPPSDP